MSYSIIYLKISFWEALSVDFKQYYFFKPTVIVFEPLQVVVKAREVSRSVWLAKLYDITRNQLLGHSERRFRAIFNTPGIKYVSKSKSESSIRGPVTQGGPEELPRVENSPSISDDGKRI